MAIVKSYLHVCKQAAARQKTLVTELLPLLAVKKSLILKSPFQNRQLRTCPGNLGGDGMLSASRPHPAAMPWLPRDGGAERGRNGDRGPACHPHHIPGTLQGN